MNPEVPTAGDVDRAPAVRDMFDRIAPRYDLANRVLSLGLDQGWRRTAIRALGTSIRGDMVDLCAGTLDLTEMLVDGGARHVHAVDFSEGMLKAGLRQLPADVPVTTLVADAQDLPLPDASADGIICGFGLRNVPDLERVLDQCARVLRPGGRMVILDFFRPTNRMGRLLQSTYNRRVVPIVGGWVTGFGDAYRYLNESIDAFVSRQDLEQRMSARDMATESFDLFPPVAGIVIGTLPQTTRSNDA